MDYSTEQKYDNEEQQPRSQANVLQSMLVANASICNADKTFLSQGFLKLPIVEKDLQVGPRGALYYINPMGKKMYLTPRMRNKLAEEQLSGCVGEYCDIGSVSPVYRKHSSRFISEEE